VVGVGDADVQPAVRLKAAPAGQTNSKMLRK
jgi:hypothetical protein